MFERCFETAHDKALVAKARKIATTAQQPPSRPVSNVSIVRV